MEKLQTTGAVFLIRDTAQITDSFKKREFVVEIDNPNDYRTPILFEVTQDRCEVLDNFKLGDRVKVFFNLRGREWNGKYFVSLQAWKIEKEVQG